MMSKEYTTVFIIDDELPIITEFRKNGIYNNPISIDNLYHLAVNSEWSYHLEYLQQLIKDLYSSDLRIEGRINLIGFTSPTQAIKEIKNGGSTPDIIIYDWEYPNAPAYSENASNWLQEIFTITDAFVFVYSNLVNKENNIIPRTLNHLNFYEYAKRFQVFLKGGKINVSSFSTEEFIFQHIIGLTTDRGSIKINGLNVEFTKNNFLKNASDILYLQRILGNEFILDELGKTNFRLDEFTSKEILDSQNNFLYFDKNKNILVYPNDTLNEETINRLDKISYSDVVKKYSLEVLEDTIERGYLVL